MADNQMKKPPSHITTILIFSFCGLLGLVQAYGLSKQFNTPIWISLIFPCIFLIVLFGIVKIQKWSRIYCSVIIGLLMIFSLVMPIMAKTYDQNLIFAVCIDGLLAWWLYTFAFGKASREYFNYKNTLQNIALKQLLSSCF